MQYLLLIYTDEDQWNGLGDAERGSLMQEYATFTKGLRESGAYVDGAQLQPSSTATTVRVRQDERLVTDGPYAETKEQLGGFYLVEAESLDEAIAHAGRIPGARHGSIEVRPLVPVRAEAAA